MPGYQLKRSLGLALLTLYGLGNILGAGIYVLVGKVAAVSGASAPLAFIVAMMIAALTAFSYMELAGRYPVSASVSVYLHKAFGRRWLSVMIGLAMVAGGITSAAALSLGFGGYLNVFIDIPEVLAAVGILMALGLLALKGINESAVVAALFTIVEITGLVLIIWFGRGSLSDASLSQTLSIQEGIGISGVLSGAFLAFYAFIGFEDMVNVAEEVKRPRVAMPLAILFSLVISAALYLLVVMVSVANVAAEQLGASSAPLALVFQKVSPLSPLIISAIGIAAAINGVVVQIIMGSRILYGLAKRGWLHHELARLHKVRRTPMLATVIVVSLMVVSALSLPLVSLAGLTSILVLAIFSLVNVALLVIKRRQPRHNGYITVPYFVPALGLVSCIGIILFQLVNAQL